MKMFANLRAFLYELYEDLSAHSGDIENSFYYSYIRNKKEKQAEVISGKAELFAEYADRDKPNKFVLLHAAYLAFKNGDITADKYRDIFGKVSEGKKRTAGFLAADIVNADDAKEYNDALEKYLLKNLVSDFFDNAGFKKGAENVEQYFEGNLKLTQNTRARNKYSRHSKSLDKYTDYIDMLYSYLQYKNAELSDGPVSRSAEITDAFKNECAELFRSLSRDPECGVFMPLYFDPVSGAGIFIIGKDRFDDELRGEVAESCAACIVHFSDISVDVEMSYGNTVMSLDMYVDICRDVRSAFDEFESGVDTESYLVDYSDVNEVGKDTYTDRRFDGRFRQLMSLRGEMTAEKIKEKQDIEELKQNKARYFTNTGRSLENEKRERQNVKEWAAQNKK